MEMEMEMQAQSGMHKPGTALFAGFDLEANVHPLLFGLRQQFGGHTNIWRMIVTSSGAMELGLVFDGFALSEGQTMFVYTPNHETVHGPFHKGHNTASGFFTTPLTASDSLLIEIHATAMGSIQNLQALRLKSLIHLVDGNYAQWDATPKNIGASGTCNVNINCVEGQNWQRQKRGVARMNMLVGGRRYLCTGTLINNTRNDGAMLFLTAHHCGAGATPLERQQWQFYFNFERPGCSNQGTPPDQMLTGAELLASAPISNGSDFQLLRIAQTAPREWNLFWNGWNRTDNPGNSGVTIHHPGGDSKKISTYWETTTPATPSFGTAGTMTPNSAWRVVWAPTLNGHGVTEGGSSGSPLFNENGLVIGTLAGGNATCSQITLPDFFGRFSYHWNRNGTHHTISLAPHLDPLGTGSLSLGGFDPNDTSSISTPDVFPDGLASLLVSHSHNRAVVRFNQNLNRVNVSLYSVQGSLLSQQNFTNARAGQMEFVPTAGLSHGVYLIRVSTPEQSTTLKLLLTY